MTQPPSDLRQFSSLLKIVEALRGPDGCPWDKEQTHRSLTPYAIEEAHELAEAIEAGDSGEMVSELGDLLLQVVLHSEIGRQEGRFEIADVISSITEKMVRRHPHVFGDVEVSGSSEVLDNWAKIKESEKTKPRSENKFEVPVALPALARSQKIGEKTKRFRFDWPDAESVVAKVDEELNELKAEMRASLSHVQITQQATQHATQQTANQAALEHELGDLLFSAAQLARHLGLEAEQCLRSANARFEARFFAMKDHIEKTGRDYDKVTSAELEEAWQTIKRQR